MAERWYIRYHRMYWEVHPEEEVVEPLMEIRISGKEIRICFDIPGVDKSSLDVQASDNSIVLRAAARIGGRTVIYFKHVNLPIEIDPDRVRARLTSGVLELVAPVRPRGFRRVSVE